MYVYNNYSYRSDKSYVNTSTSSTAKDMPSTTDGTQIPPAADSSLSVAALTNAAQKEADDFI